MLLVAERASAPCSGGGQIELERGLSVARIHLNCLFVGNFLWIDETNRVAAKIITVIEFADNLVNINQRVFFDNQ